MGDQGQRVVAACKKHWEAHKSDCSGFARAVAGELGVKLDGDANQIAATIRSGAGWTTLDGGATAALRAGDGFLVIGGLAGSEQATKDEHGHVVVVVPGSPDRGKYPHAYWGRLHGVGREDATVNFAWNIDDRDRVRYAMTPLA